MVLKILALLPFLFAAPEIQVDFSDAQYRRVDVRVVGKDELVDSCLKSGLSLRYEFDVRICKHRPLWFDICQEERQEKHELSYDAISGNYRLVVDRFGDAAQPATKNFNSLREAVARFGRVDALPLLFLARDQNEFVRSRRSYVSVRVMSECHGDYNKTVAQISSFLTLGLFRVSGFDTGWSDFTLRRNQGQ